MRIFVTGGSGFLGKSVCAALHGHDVAYPTHAHCDLGKHGGWIGRELADFQPEVCIHLAWEGLPDYSPENCQKNYDLTVCLHELYRFPRFISVGTCFEYGDLHGAVTEDQYPANLSLFAATKHALRLYGERLARQQHTQFVWLRPFWVYGPGQRPTSLLPQCYAALKAGEQVSVFKPDGVCDFIHVDDVASAIAALAVLPVTGTFNLGTGQPHLVREAVGMLRCAVEGKSFLPWTLPLGQGFYADLTKTRAVLPEWCPRSLSQGIADTVREWEKA